MAEPQYLTARKGVWHFLRRVPTEYAHLDPRGKPGAWLMVRGHASRRCRQNPLPQPRPRSRPRPRQTRGRHSIVSIRPIPHQMMPIPPSLVGVKPNGAPAGLLVHPSIAARPGADGNYPLRRGHQSLPRTEPASPRPAQSRTTASNPSTATAIRS